MKAGARRINLWLVVMAASLVVLVAVYDLTRERLAEGSYIRDLNGKMILTFLPKLEPETLPGLSTATDARFATGSVNSPDHLWALHGKPGDWKLVDWHQLFEGTRGTTDSRYELTRRMTSSYPGRIGPFDLGTWDQSDPDLFFFDESGSRVTVRRMPLGIGRTAGAVRVEGRTPRLERLPASSFRTFSMATYSGSRPDLYVIDSQPGHTWRITVYSGESRFSRLIGTFESSYVKSGELAEDEWVVGIMDRIEGKPDLGLITDGLRSGSNHLEMHFGIGDTDFEDFPLRIATDRQGEHLPDHQLLLVPLTLAGDDGSMSGGVLDVFPRDGRYRVVRISALYKEGGPD